MDDLTGLGKAVEKFLDVVSRGAGALYRPRAIRKEGEAEAAKVLMIENAKAQAEEDRKAIAIAGHINRVAELSNGDPGLIERTRARLVMQEIEGQKNIEAIADEALRQLPNEASDEPVSPEWTQRFFKHAADVSTADMQRIWAGVLAREIATPNTFAPRTLDTLHNLTKQEAEAFTRLLSLSFLSPLQGPMKLRSDITGAFPAFGSPFLELMSLREAGLVTTADSVAMRFVPNVFIVLAMPPYIIELQPVQGERKISFLTLTRAGEDLRRVVKAQPNLEYLKACIAQLAADGYAIKVLGSDDLSAYASALQRQNT